VTRKETSIQIVDAALRILQKEGPDAVSMRQIARAVGVTPMALYHHFPNRDALLQAATDQEFEKLARSITRLSATGTTESQLRKVMDCYCDYAFTHPRIFDYVFSHPRAGARRFPEDFKARRSPTLNRVADIVESGMERREIRQGDVWEIALQVWALVHGYVVLFRGGRFSLSQEDLRQLCHRSLRRLMHGLKP
jgi:AcrR family transcriptional regulator